MEKKYDSTIILPKKKISMKANLPSLGNKVVEYWDEIELHKKMQQNKGKDFVLLNGPPYSNGPLHIGHAENISVKSIIMLFKHILGYKVITRPGHDCHGQAIELKVLEKNPELSGSISQLRRGCEKHSEYWIQEHQEKSKKLLLITDYSNAYKTMSHEAQVIIAKVLYKLLLDEFIIRKKKPITWSISEQTSLSDAETEYREHMSTAIDVGLSLKSVPKNNKLEGKLIVIWTTTPWTLLGNKAVAYNVNFTYLLIKINNFQCIIAKDLIETFIGRLKTHHEMDFPFVVLEEIPGSVFEGAYCTHPLLPEEVPLLHSKYVTNDTGTGFVHMAPAHGEEDFEVCTAHGIEAVDYIDESGYYSPAAPLFCGAHIFDHENEIINFLNDSNIEDSYFKGVLLSCIKYKHNYVYSQRGNCPTILKLTYQWFICLDKNNLRERCLKAVKEVDWHPSRVGESMYTLLKNRSEWVISRSRYWGSPLGFFYDKNTQKPLLDKELYNNIIKDVEKEGHEFLFQEERMKKYLVERNYNPEEYFIEQFTLDVWVESGLVPSILGIKQGDICIEGKDQTRGWFQSLLFLCMYLNDIIPYKSVFTHGFVLSENGTKMSKSKNNVISIDHILDKFGIDLFRILIVSSDVYEDIKIGDNSIEKQRDFYDKIRNVFCFLLGTTPNEMVNKDSFNIGKLSIIDKWMLRSIALLEVQLKEYAETYQIRNIFDVIFKFLSREVSAVYIDYCKDSLYCDDPNNDKRKSIIFVLSIIRDFLLKWLSPIIPVFAEEIYHSIICEDNQSIEEKFSRKKNENQPDSVLLVNWENLVDNSWEKFQQEYKIVEDIRNIISHWNSVIGNLKKENTLPGNLDLKITSHLPIELVPYIELITDLGKFSKILYSNTIEGEEKIIVERTSLKKCERCWKRNIETNNELCIRCINVLGENI